MLISVAGQFCVDLVPRLSSARVEPGKLFDIGPLDIRLGGCVANTGLALRDLGADVELQAMIGDDPLGELAVKLLQAGGQVSARLTALPGVATSYTIVLEPGGADRTLWNHVGANARFDTAELVGDLLHLGYPPLIPAVLADGGAPLLSLFERARAAGMTTSLDFAFVDPESWLGTLDWPGLLGVMMAVTDVASPSVDDLRSMLGIEQPGSLDLADALCRDLIAAGAAVAMVTAGEHGLALRAAPAARLASGGRVLAALGPSWADAALTLPSIATHLVTSTGAGDAATAGLLCGLAEGLGPEASGRLAAATAAAVMSGRRPTPEVIAGLAPGLVRS